MTTLLGNLMESWFFFFFFFFFWATLVYLNLIAKKIYGHFLHN
jgi:hypothetical protein